MKKIDISIISAVIGIILVMSAAMLSIGDKVDFAITLIGVYFILAGVVTNRKLKEFLKG